MNLTTRLRLLSLLLVCACAGLTAAAADKDTPLWDTLVYADGDRIHGRLVSSTPELIEFQSERFGRISVPADKAVVIKAEPAKPMAASSPPATAQEGAKAAAKARAERTDTERIWRWENFSPAVLTARVREYFGPWTGRLAFSTEVVSDTADRNNVSMEMRMKRKWKSDEVQLNTRYDYSETSERPTTDTLKADGLWRHDFSKNSFVQYRPTVEWNRASFRASLPTDYVLVQQEIGAGLNLINRPARKLRVGLSENLFDVWTVSPPASHKARTSESVFLETELKLPWGLLLTDRSVYYYSFSSQRDGWENRVELTKKFTETFSTAIRHEIRRGSPDGTAQDYTRLRLLLGLDF